MKHLILVGACYLDTILSVPRYPEEDSKLRATDIRTRRGGNCPNSLEVLQQLGGTAQLHLVSTLPRADSVAAKRIRSSFGQDSSIHFGHCLYREHFTEAASSYVIKSQDSGTRTIVNYNDLPEMTFDEFADVAGKFRDEEDTWWHFEGRIPETTLACIAFLRHKLPSAKISVEVEKPSRQGLSQLAAEADVVFYSRAWAESRGHISAEACLMNERRRQGSLGLCTWGASGATAVSQDFGCLHCPVTKVSVIDSVGAGDTFIAGMLYGLTLNNWPSADVAPSVSFAVKLATLKVQQEGFDGLGTDSNVCMDKLGLDANSTGKSTT